MVIESTPTEKEILSTHKTGSIIGIILGGILSILGVVMLTSGLTGSIEWIVKAGGLSSKLINASPGVVVVIVGAFLAMHFKPKFHYEREIIDNRKHHHEKVVIKVSSPIKAEPKPLPLVRRN